MRRPFNDPGHEVCRLLLWKEKFIEAENDPTVQPSNSQIYWCSETQVCLGPDGKVASPEDCKPGRSCYDELSLIKFT